MPIIATAPAHALASLATLPFAAQLRVIEHELDSGRAPAALLRALAGLRDHEPLARAILRAGQAGLLSAAPDALAEVLTMVPDTGVQRVLRALDRTPIPAAQRDAVVAAVERALETLPLERAAALCLMDRWLKNASPKTREAVVERAVAALARALADSALGSLAGEVLMRVPGQRLASVAAALPEGARAAREARLAAFAGRVLDILGAAPKSLSQANAEELLSRRVYTDPGHFLVELLQNAEDAGARTWRADIGDHDVAVWHDGTPFDAKDVVGVLSIGQTTKHKEQIGFFGVGFKSVYEICERPQVYSGPFCFEIADVSIPRRLAARPEGRPGAGTLLALPLRNPRDPERAPDRLYERALSVPPETLLTLRNIREIAVARGARSRAVCAEARGPHRVDLVHVESGERTGYLTTGDRFTYDGGAREGSRAGATDILVAMRLDQRGMPVPLSENDATIYSYLPTRERPGLRLLVHAHFDLPVDRERLDLDSAYNRWVLARAGTLVARAARAAIHGDGDDHDDRAPEAALDRARAVLGILPRADELAHPAYAALADSARRALAEVPCLPGADRTLVAPCRAAMAADQRLVDVLAGVDLDGHGLRLLAVLPDRAARAAAYLGAVGFDTGDLAALVARDPACLDRGEIALLDALGRDVDHPAIGHLSEVAFVRDTLGQRRRPGEVARADRALRAVYTVSGTTPGATARPLLAAELDPRAGAEVDPGPERRGAAGPGTETDRTSGNAPARDRLWRRLDVPVLDTDSLLADLHREPVARAILARDGVARLITYLAARPAHLAGFIDAVARGHIPMDADRARDLHAALDSVRDDLPPRLCARIGQAPLFPDRAGALRPLAGPAAALVPADGDIVAMAPDAPWLDPGVAALPYIGRLLDQLGATPAGAADVARALLREDDRLLDTTGDAAVRHALAYLSTHADELSAALGRRLAEAPVWFSDRGARLPLNALRRPPCDPTLAALYGAWDAFPLIDEQGPGHGAPSALAVATALGLATRVAVTDHDTLVDDLHRDLEITPPARALVLAALADAASILPRQRLARAARAAVFLATDGALHALAAWSEPAEPAGSGCGHARGVLRAALGHGSRPLLAADDELALAGFLDAAGVAPATVADLVAAIERDPAMQAAPARDHARRALAALPDELASRFAAEPRPGRMSGIPRLEALPIWPCTDGVHRPATAVVRGRDITALLAGDAQADAPAASDWQEAFAAAGGHGADRHGPDGRASGGHAASAHGLLDEAAAAEADALAGLVAFADPRSALRATIAAVARPGDPLEAQHALLAGAARVARLARTVAQDAGTDAARALPLAVDAEGRLVAGSRYRADARTRRIARGLPLHDHLADPDWAAGVGDELAPPVTLRQVLAAIADDAREAAPMAGHPRLSDPGRRADLYAWLLEHGDEILADDQARGLLGRASVIATPGGHLRPVRELLLDRELPDLGIDWNAADEVPAALVAWLRRHFAPGERQLGRLVEHLASAHDQAARAGDGPRSAELLDHLARSLRVGEAAPDQVTEAVRRFKLRRRLRVEADSGELARPRALLAPPPEDWALVTGFASAPPARVSARYSGERVRALIARAGAAARLDDATLRALIAGTGRAEGPAAAIALARYLARWATREPALREALHLRTAAWIPDGSGVLRPAGGLYWPDSDAPLIVGDDPRRYPHPELAHTAPAELAAWLPFRRIEDAALDDVVAHIDALLGAGRVPGPEILAWLDRGLERGHLRAADVRAALAERRFLRDDDGVLREPDQVVREGARELFASRRGTWSVGDEHTRLAAALKIPKRPGKREVLGYFDEIAAEIRARCADPGADTDAAVAAVLAGEHELLATLPRCLAVLADAGGALPPRLPLACETTAGVATLCIAPDPRLALPVPAAAVDAAITAGAPYIFPLLPEGDDGAVLALLAALGIPDLSRDTEMSPTADVGPTEAIRADMADLDTEQRGPGREHRRGRGHAPAHDHEREGGHAPAHDDRDGHDGRDGRPHRPTGPDPRVTTTESLPEQSRGLIARIRSWLTQQGEDDEREDTAREDSARKEAERDGRREPGSAGQSGALPRTPRDRIRPSRPGPDSDGSGADTLPATPDQRLWFRPRQRIGAQMHDHSAWLGDRRHAATYGLAFQPRVLPAPYVYGPQTIAGRFQPAGQRWIEIPLDPAWRNTGREGTHTMLLRGRIPVGEVILPVPLFGQVIDIRATPPARLLETRGGAPLLVAADDTDIEYTVSLPSAPSYDLAGAGAADASIDVPGELLAPTAADRELPDEALRFVDDLVAAALPPLQRALAVRDFVRARYYYDPAYLESPEVARWLERLTRGRSNAHLAALHAGRDGRYLGRGVCYELNAMACELLRRAGVPAAVATGWTFDRGYLDEPDHMWAMALLGTDNGASWLPIDASTTRDGRPLHVGRRPPGPWRAPADGPRSAPQAPSWDRGQETRRYEADPAPLGDLVRVVRYLEERTGQELGHRREIRDLCRQVLHDAAAGHRLLELLRALTDTE